MPVHSWWSAGKLSQACAKPKGATLSREYICQRARFFRSSANRVFEENNAAVGDLFAEWPQAGVAQQWNAGLPLRVCAVRRGKLTVIVLMNLDDADPNPIVRGVAAAYLPD